jgi:hypothetical protein
MKYHRVLYLPILGFLLLILCIPVPALAWGNTWLGVNLERIVSTTRGKSGPFRYNMAIQVENAGYDSDLYYGYTLEQVPDYTFTAGLNFRAFLPIKKKVVFEVSAIPQYAFYLRTKNERALNGEFNGQIHFVLDRVYFQLGGGFSTVRDRLGPEVTVRVRHQYNDVFGLLLWQPSKDASFAFQYRRFFYRYADLIVAGSNLRDTLNRTEDYINIRAYLQQVSRARFFLDGEYGIYNFAEALSSDRNSRSYSAYGGIELAPAEGGEFQIRGIQGRLNLGYKYFDIRDPRGQDYSGLVGNSTLALGIFKTTALQAFFDRDVQFSAYSDFNYYLQTTYGGGIVHFFSRRLLFGYELSFLRVHYPGVNEGAPTGPAVYRYILHSPRLLLRLRENLEISIFGNLGSRKSSLIEGAVNRTFVGLSLTYGYISGTNPLLSRPSSR